MRKQDLERRDVVLLFSDWKVPVNTLQEKVIHPSPTPLSAVKILIHSLPKTLLYCSKVLIYQNIWRIEETREGKWQE